MSQAFRKPIPPRAIVNAVSAAFDVPSGQIYGPRREHQMIAARQAAAWLMRHIAGMSTPQIGRALGGRDHTTILHALGACEDRMAADSDYRLTVLTIRNTLTTLHALGYASDDNIDPLAVAQHVLRQPDIHAVSPSCDEIVAMSALLLDFAEFAEGVRAFLSAFRLPETIEKREERIALYRTLNSMLAQFFPQPEVADGAR